MKRFNDRCELAANSPSAAEAGHGKPGFQELFRDVMSLAELQVALFARDLVELRRGAVGSLILLTTGVVMAIASLPVLVAGLGLLVSTMLELPIWAGLLITSVVLGVIPAAVIVSVGWRSLFRNLATLDRSAGEMRKNVAWLRRRLGGRSGGR